MTEAVVCYLWLEKIEGFLGISEGFFIFGMSEVNTSNVVIKYTSESSACSSIFL